ncbi:MAG: metallophosphoesterase [Erysipelotrichia bacterium]|nr:metallophosphoesterase [Erysipelotrichia bacterium]
MRSFIPITSILICCLFGGCTSEEKAAMLKEDPEVLELIQATDLHYLSPSLTDHGSAFEAYITKSDGKDMEYSEELITAFLDEVIQKKPHILVLTGDLTYSGEKKSHIDLADKLKKVERAGIQVCVIPGNHDMYSSTAVSFKKDSYTRVDSITSDEFTSMYSSFGYAEALARDPDSLSYIYQCAPSTRLLFVDVNASEVYNHVSNSTLQWIEEQLKQAEEDHVRVIAFSHQSMLKQTVFSAGYVIDNGIALERLYEQYDVLANFSGHLHIQHTRTGEHNIPEAITSSLAVSPNQYAEIALSSKALDYQTKCVDVSAWALSNHSDNPDLLDFAAYSKMFFDDNSYRTACEEYQYISNAEELAQYFVRLNNAYFQGRANTIEFNHDLNNQINKMTDHLSGYILSIRQEKTDMNHMHVDLD